MWMVSVFQVFCKVFNSCSGINTGRWLYWDYIDLSFGHKFKRLDLLKCSCKGTLKWPYLNCESWTIFLLLQHWPNLVFFVYTLCNNVGKMCKSYQNIFFNLEQAHVLYYSNNLKYIQETFFNRNLND